MKNDKTVMATKVDGKYSDILTAPWAVVKGIPEGFEGTVVAYIEYGNNGELGLFDGDNTVYYHKMDAATVKDIYRLLKNKKVVFNKGKFITNN